MKKKKRKPINSTKIVEKMLRDDGYTVDRVEHWNQFAKKRKDLFNFIDLLAMKPGEPLIGVQITTRSNVAGRLQKIRSLPEHRTWLSSGCRILVVGLPRVVELKMEGTQMLVLSRKIQEVIVINESVSVTVVDISRGRVRLAINAPKNVRIVRKEILQDAKENENAKGE